MFSAASFKRPASSAPPNFRGWLLPFPLPVDAAAAAGAATSAPDESIGFFSPQLEGTGGSAGPAALEALAEEGTAAAAGVI